MNKSTHKKSNIVAQNTLQTKLTFLDRHPIYGLDNRSVLLFRFCLGLLLLFNLITYKFGSYFNVYSPVSGFLGNDFILNLANDKPVSWLRYLTKDYLMLAFFFVSAVFYLLYSINIKPFFVAIGAYVCYSSINLRYFPVRAGWDFYIDVLLFLSIFLSIPTTHDERNENKSVFSYVIIFQIGIIYFFAAIFKSGIAWKDGTAVAYILNDYTLNKPLGIWLFQHAPKAIIRLFTYATLFWEFILIFLLFLPYKNQKIRLIISVSILLFHWTINLFADVGHFKYIATCAAILLIPELFWNKISEKYHVSFIALKHRWSSINFPVYITRHKLFNKILKFMAVYLVLGIITSNVLVVLQIKEKISESNSKKIRSLFPRKSYFFSQNWSMYSPNPMSELGTLKMEGVTLNDTLVNLITGENITKNIFSKDFNRWSFNNQLLTIFKAKIVQQKDEEVIKRWFQYYINRYTTNKNYPKIKTAYLYLYSIHGNEYVLQKKMNIQKTEIIKADISY